MIVLTVNLTNMVRTKADSVPGTYRKGNFSITNQSTADVSFTVLNIYIVFKLVMTDLARTFTVGTLRNRFFLIMLAYQCYIIVNNLALLLNNLALLLSRVKLHLYSTNNFILN